MGNLKPGATYIYERNKGEVYAREFGSSERKLIGYEYGNDQRTSGQKELDDHNEWIKIRLAGKSNPALQKAIDRVKMLYKLSMEKYE
jgi:hypothetical protein